MHNSYLTYRKLLGFAAATLLPLGLNAANWVGGTDVFHTPTAWDTGVVPGSATLDQQALVMPNGNSHITANAATWTYLDTNSLLNSSTSYRGVNRLLMGTAGSGRTSSLTLDVGNANTFQFTNSGTHLIGERSGNIATVNLISGIMDIGGTMTVGNNSIGTINIQGGTYRQGRNTLIVANGTGTGLVSIDSGSLITRQGVAVNNGGTFRVIGSDASQIGIGSVDSLDGEFTLNSGALLDMRIDTGGITSIFVDAVDGDGGQFATFNLGSLLNLDFDGIGPIAGTWTLLELENGDITDSGLSLAGGVANGWSFNVDNSGVNGLLTATYIPEPGIYSLLAGCLSLTAVMLRRRKA